MYLTFSPLPHHLSHIWWISSSHTCDAQSQKLLMSLIITEVNLTNDHWTEGRMVVAGCVSVHFSSNQSLSCSWLFVTPWTTARQASLSITNSISPPKPVSIMLVMPSNHLILCHPLLLLLSIFPSIRVFSNRSALRIRQPKYWSFSFKISPSNENSGLSPFGWTGWISL